MRSLETTNKTRKSVQKECDVLFQKIGQRWYIFTENNNELIYSVMPEGMDPRETKLELYDVIEEHMVNMSQKNRSAEI